jgi:hypothetical protein
MDLGDNGVSRFVDCNKRLLLALDADSGGACQRGRVCENGLEFLLSFAENLKLL